MSAKTPTSKTMNNIEQTIKKFLKDYNLDKPENIFLVAFSGGSDSICLLNSLKNICNNHIIAIHLNHNWRGEESDKEEKNCKDFCNTIGIDFYSEKLNETIAHTETQARNARYSFFEKCAKKFNSNIIFTAHNKNDNAETVLYRISKGTGIPGLCGILPQRDIYYRPLINTDRTEIEKYCRNNNLTPNNDSSNTDSIHKRNLIRNEVFPLLAQINPNITDSLNSLSKNAKENEEIISEYINIIRNKICKNEKYDIKEFLKLQIPVQMRIIYNILTPLVPQDYDRQRIQILLNFIIDNCESKSGKICSVTNGYNLFVCEKYFELLKVKEKEKNCIKINKIGEYSNGRVSINICECDKLPDKSNRVSGRTIYVDLSTLDFEFELRNRQDGDIIQPMGMKGHQKLKKYLNSRKIPNHQKEELLFLAQNNEILWAIDIGLSDKIKITSLPTHKIEVKINGN